METERSTLTKNRKLEKSFEDLLTGLSDENDDDIDDLVNFDNLPEMCSDATLIAITKSNKPYTNANMDDSLKISDFGEGTDFMSKSSKNNENNSSDIFGDDFMLEQSKDKGICEDDKLIDFEVSTTTKTEFQNDELLTFENGNKDHKAEKLIDFDDYETDEKNINEFDMKNMEDENSIESNEVDEDDDKYDANFDMENDIRTDNRIELMVTDESGNALDTEKEAEEMVNGLNKEDSIDLDVIVQDNTKLDVDIGKQKTVLRKKGSLAKRRKPSRNSVHSMIGGTDEESHFTDSTEPKPVIQNGNADEDDVFSRQSSSNDSDATSPTAKKPLPGMVALPGMGMPLGFPRKKTSSSTPSDSDVTPDEQNKDFRNIGVKLPKPISCGTSESDNQSDISSPVLKKTSERELFKQPTESTPQFEKPKLRAVSRPTKDKNENNDSKMFDIPVLRQVERSPTKSKASEDGNLEDMDSKHTFQTPKLRRVENAPTESLQFVHGKTGESDESQSRISDDSQHLFQTPKLKKIDNPPTQTLRLLHGQTDDSESKISLGHHNEESSTDDIDIGMYFEKPQLRNVPKPTQTLRNIEKSQFEVPVLKSMPKMELELKSPSSSESDKKFNVPQLKSVQKEKVGDNHEKEEGTFQIPSLRNTPLPKRKDPPKSPETKTFDVPVLRRTPRVKTDTEQIETEKHQSGLFEKPKLKSARSLQQDMDDNSNKDSFSKHRFDMPTLRNTPSKSEHSVQRSDSTKHKSEKPSWLQDTKLRPTRGQSVDSVDKHEEKPSWLTSPRDHQDAKENKNTNSQEILETTPRKSSIPLKETRDNTGPQSPRNRLTSTGSEHTGDEHKVKKGRDQYVPSWLKTTDTRGKSPSTPNLAFCTPPKDASEVPQWKKDLAEKRRGRKGSDVGISPKKPESTKDKEQPPWKLELGQMKMRHTPLKAQETKKSSEPEWKKAADEKRQRLRKAAELATDLE